jgi:hypothetical protein
MVLTSCLLVLHPHFHGFGKASSTLETSSKLALVPLLGMASILLFWTPHGSHLLKVSSPSQSTLAPQTSTEFQILFPLLLSSGTVAKFIPYLTPTQLEKSLISTYLAHNYRITHAGPPTIQVPLQSNLLTLLIKNLDLTL